MVVFRFHVRIRDRFAQNMLIEGASKIAIQKLVVVDRFGNDTSGELEVGQMVGVALRVPVREIRRFLSL